MSVLGLENWGVLVTLNASSLNSNPMPSRIEKRRKAAASKLKKPGPLKAYRAMLPCTPLALAGQFTATPFANFVTAFPTGQNADVSNQKLLSIPPSIWKGATGIGVCVVPLAASELPLGGECNGVRLIRVALPV